MHRLQFLLVILLTSTAMLSNAVGQSQPVGADHAERSRQGLKLFHDSVREILTKNCLDCHGGKSIKADFDLATRDTLTKSGFVDKTAADSYLMELIRHESDPVMPFKADKLSDDAIAAIAKWIDLGAPYDKPLVERDDTASGQPMKVTDDDRQFWSFQPLANVTAPEIQGDAWSRTPLDRFVFSKLHQSQLAPNAIADRRTLIRRAYLDLIGLPPEPAEVEEFVNDPDPRAYEKRIDHLLQSEHYGERWARHWMDVARFAESMGFEHDYDRSSAYHYRDFLIQAFNRDMPWDQMVRWQLAGDEIAPDENLALMATGFLAAGVFPTQLTETEFESARYDELDDIVATMGVAFLGLSTGCARCHDHKFDPIPTRDYYALVATFATTIRSEKEIEFNAAEYKQRLQAWQQKHAQLTESMSKFEAEQLEPRFSQWLSAPQIPDDAVAGTWMVLSPTSVTSRDGATLTQQPDAAWLASGKNPASDEYTMVADVAQGATALQIEALTHPSMPGNGPGRAGNGNFALGHLTIDAVAGDVADHAESTPIKLVNPRATHQQNTGGLSVASSIDDDINTSGWAVDLGGIGKDQAAIFEFEKPLDQRSRLTIRMRFHVNTSHTLGRFRLSVANQRDAEFQFAPSISAELASAFALAGAGKTKQLNLSQRSVLRDWFASRDAAWLQQKQALDAHQAQRPKPDIRKVLYASEGVKPISHHADGRGYPHFYPEVYRLSRGDVKQKQEVMKPGVLQVLTAARTTALDANTGTLDVEAISASTTKPGTLSYRRTALADWMTDPSNGAGHLLARVAVNRLWQHHLGRGIVSTPNDFGFQGDRPTHPDLLDWLAGQLIEGGWRLKPIHKMIMTSAVYMQSNETDEHRTTADIDNLLWWRFQPRRLEAEAIRDSLLSVSGSLDTTMYGPGTLNEAMRRRSVYFKIKRSRFVPMMQIFDWPEHLVSIGRRSETAIAPQALALMNGSEARAYATAMANRVRSSQASTSDAIESAYRLAFGRVPTQQEATLAAEFINDQTQRYVDDKQGETLALIDFCQALFCSNEFLYLP